MDDKYNDELAREAAQTIIEMDAAVGHTARDSKQYTDRCRTLSGFSKKP